MGVVQFKQPEQVDNKNNGFVMTSRSIKKTVWYKNINARLLYLELSLEVAHTGYATIFNGHEVTLTTGQYVTKATNLAKEIQCTKNQAEYALTVLEKHGVITTKTIGKQTNRCTLITLNLTVESQARDSAAFKQEESQKQRATSEVSSSFQARDAAVNQEGSKSIKDNTCVFPKKEPKKQNPAYQKSEGIVKDSFNHLWFKFPSAKHRVNKKGCLKTYSTLCAKLNDDGVVALVNKISNHLDLIVSEAKDIQYLPTAPTYFNQERWEDNL